jgi:hypothetical protein
MWEKAEIRSTKPGDVAGKEDEIVDWEKEINSLNCIYLNRKSYWEAEALPKSSSSGTPKFVTRKSGTAFG